MNPTVTPRNPVAPVLDAARVSLALGVVALLAIAWLTAAATFTEPASALPWIVLNLACLGVVLAPRLAGAADRRQHFVVASLGAVILVIFAALAHALALAPLGIAAMLAAIVGALLALGASSLLVRPTVAATPATPATPDAPGPGATRTALVSAAASIMPSTPTLLPEALGTNPPDDDALEIRCAPGVRIGRYKLEQRIAVGGMGEVWRARHDTLIRPAVLKLVKRRDGADSGQLDELMERFRREAITTANLTSPHTVHLYDFGVEGKTFYIAMELLEAASIAALVERFGPMEEARVAFLLRQACHSLIEAHDHGVVHRDIKPDNLLITRAGRDPDFLKVIDFGLVKELAGARKRGSTGRSGRAVQLTAFGARPGTPGYMAPEQASGAGVDERSDIYALACVAYFALTGLPVFEGTQDAQLMFAHMEIEPEAPSARVRRPLHAGLEAVIMRCLAKNPADRPETMAELDRELAALAFDEPWTQDRARQWWDDERSKLRVPADDPRATVG